MPGSEYLENNGSPGVSRTPDLRFRKPLLYPSELRGQSSAVAGVIVQLCFLRGNVWGTLSLPACSAGDRISGHSFYVNVHRCTQLGMQKTAAAGIATKGKCAGASHEAGGSGHVNGKHGGQGQFSFNYDDSNQPTGSASFSDPGSGVNFQSTQVTAATFDDTTHTVTLSGSGTDNGSPVAFTIVAAELVGGPRVIQHYPRRRVQQQRQPAGREHYRLLTRNPDNAAGPT